MDIRYSRGMDELCLLEWMRDPETQAHFPCCGDEEVRMFCRTWMYYSSKQAGLSLVENDRCIAMAVLILMPYQKVKHHALCHLVVDPKIKDPKYADVLMKNLVHLAKSYLNLEALYMEYIGGKPWLDFYKNHGFKVYAEQKNYMLGPYPDKILLECIL